MKLFSGLSPIPAQRTRQPRSHPLLPNTSGSGESPHTMPTLTSCLSPFPAQEHAWLPSSVGKSLEASPAFPELPVNKLNGF